LVSRIVKRKGLSEVVSTLLLLVVAVLLAAVATYYATNITMTRTESEQMSFSKAHVWVNSTGAIGAFRIQNLGGKDILIDKISIRGVEEAWTDVYYNRIASGTAFTSDLTVCKYTAMTGSSYSHAGKTYTQTSGDLPLISGGEILVYIKGPDNIQIDDIGVSVSVSIHTSNAQHITEVNVESATTQ